MPYYYAGALNVKGRTLISSRSFTPSLVFLKLWRRWRIRNLLGLVG